MLQTDRPMMPHAQAKHIPSVHYCQGRLPAFEAISSPSGSRNGGHPTKAVPTENRRHPAATYTKRLYGSLPRNWAYLLTQLRTCHNWLSTYAKAHGFRGHCQCVCSSQETVSHVLVDCLRLREIRRELQSEVGEAFRIVSSLLGGST